MVGCLSIEEIQVVAMHKLFGTNKAALLELKSFNLSDDLVWD